MRARAFAQHVVYVVVIIIIMLCSSVFCFYYVLVVLGRRRCWHVGVCVDSGLGLSLWLPVPRCVICVSTMGMRFFPMYASVCVLNDRRAAQSTARESSRRGRRILMLRASASGSRGPRRCAAR